MCLEIGYIFTNHNPFCVLLSASISTLMNRHSDNSRSSKLCSSLWATCFLYRSNLMFFNKVIISISSIPAVNSMSDFTNLLFVLFVLWKMGSSGSTTSNTCGGLSLLRECYSWVLKRFTILSFVRSLLNSYLILKTWSLWNKCRYLSFSWYIMLFLLPLICWLISLLFWLIPLSRFLCWSSTLVLRLMLFLYLLASLLLLLLYCD